jgi:uncharacterized protein YjbJ (UPF0337 family)
MAKTTKPKSPRTAVNDAISGVRRRVQQTAEGKADRIVGLGKQIKGSLKEAAGKMIGDARLQADGEIDRVEGKAQDAVGKIKESLERKTAGAVTARRYPRSH